MALPLSPPAAPRGPLLLATANPHKVAELRAIFAEAGLPAIGLHDLPGGRDIPEPRETGDTFEANARLKALAYAGASGRPCVADVSGLEVDALGGRPGVISSHYSTDGRETGLTRAQRDEANNARLLRELAGTPPAQRGARFVCVMALALPGSHAGEPARVIHVVHGTFEGRIGQPPDVPRGNNGFGYDPLLMLPPPDARTSAELSSDEKNARSHRGQAARLIAAFCQQHFPGGF